MLLNEADKIYVGSALAAKVYLGSTQVWPSVSSTATYTYLAKDFDALMFNPNNQIFTTLQVVG